MTEPRPPRLAERLIGALVAPEHREALLDDLREDHAERCRTPGARLGAWLWYWGEACRSVGPALRWRRSRRAATQPSERGGAMRGLAGDVRHAVRALFHAPLYTVTAIAALALGIGTTTALVSLVHGVLLRPLAYPEPERVVRVYNHWEGQPDAALSPAEHYDYLEQTADVFDAFGSYVHSDVNVAGDEGAERLPAVYLTAGVLETLRLPPPLGRSLRDDDVGGPHVVLLSDALWASRFGRRPDVLGRVLEIDAQPHEVVGVLPPGLRLPDDLGERPAQLYLPLRIPRASVTERGSHFLDGVARLRHGVELETARAAIASVAARFGAEYPDDYPRDMRFGAHLVEAHEDAVAGVRPALLALLAAVVFVLMIACANVASLTLTRAEGRRRELSVRTALGATRWRLARQLLAESLILSAAGGLAGVGLAGAGLALLRRSPPDLPRIGEVSLDLTVLAVAAALSLGTGLSFGLAPLLGSDRTAAQLREGGRGASGGRRSAALRRGLVAVELALAVVLLAGAGVLLRSTRALLRVEPGYDPRQVLTTRVLLPDAGYPEDEQRRAFFARLVATVASLPGVDRAAVASHTPLAHGHGDINVELEGSPPAPGEVSPALDWTVVGPGYFELLRQPLLRGRGIDERDTTEAPGAVVLNQSAAARLYGSTDPLGRRFLLGGGAGPGWVSVVGVVADSRQEALGEPARPMMYLAHRQFRFWHGGPAIAGMSLFVRSERDLAGLTDAVRAEVSRLDPGVPTAAFLTLGEVVEASLSQERFVLRLLGGFAALALLLAAIGTYGVVGWSVAQRTREIGVRMAFGASAGRVFGLVMGQTLATAVAGVAVGLAAAAAFTPRLRALLYEVAPLDPTTLACVSALLIAVASLASLMPALRAMRVDPGVSLRSE